MKFNIIRERLQRRPFRPFDLVLNTFEHVPVSHPENIFVHQEVILVVAPNRIWEFEPEAVSAMVRPRGRPTSNGRQRHS